MRFSKQVLKSVIVDRKLYVTLNISGLYYIKNFDVRPEFYRWNSDVKFFWYPTKKFVDVNNSLLNMYLKISNYV